VSLSRLARIVAASAVALTSLAACSAINPITTQFEYAASDGLQVRVDGVLGQNLLMVTSAAGEPAMLAGSLTNESAADVSLTIILADGTETVVNVPGQSSVFLGPGQDQELVTGTASAGPGRIELVNFRTDNSGTIAREVPVVDGTLAEYAALLEGIPSPEPSPSPSPSVTPTLEPSASPEPTASPEATD